MQSKPLDDRTTVLVFDPGDEIVSTLVAFAREGAIRSASFTALGGCSRATVAYWNAATKEYEPIEIGEQVEVLSLIGDIAIGDDNQPRVHAHIALGRRDGSMIGGHLMRADVYPTLELFLVTYDVELRRTHRADTGLALLDAGGAVQPLSDIIEGAAIAEPVRIALTAQRVFTARDLDRLDLNALASAPGMTRGALTLFIKALSRSERYPKPDALREFIIRRGIFV